MTTVGLIQFDILWEDATGNADKVLSMLEKAGRDKYDLLVLPELWPCGFTMNITAWQSFDTGLNCMKQIAAKYDCDVIGGLPHKTETGQENRCYLVKPNGESLPHYAKMRVFKYAGEHKKYEQGDQRVSWQSSGFNVCPLVCYDLRFPELPRPTVPDTSMITYVANWPITREHHWRQLLVARAIENLSYVIGVNRIGTDGSGLTYPGASLIVDPTGKIVLDAKMDEGVFVTEIDPSLVDITRKQFPFLNDMEP